MSNEKDNKIEPSLEEETILHEDFGKAKTALKDEDAKWYILHTYSGYEMMVQDNLKMVFQKNNMEDRLLKIAIPMEDVIEEKGGKRKVVQRKMFPTYVYVKMHYLPNMWHMVTNTRGVTGFVGPQGRPMPLTPAEIKTLRIDIAPVFETDIKVGDAVKVMEGALAGYDGIIESVDVPNSKVKVVVSMFGKDTHVDLAMAHVDRVF